MTLLVISETMLAFADYGALGLVIILLIAALIYQTKREEKKDAKYFDESVERSIGNIKMMTDLTSLINIINTSTSNIPQEVRSAIIEDIHRIEKGIENLNK